MKDWANLSRPWSRDDCRDRYVIGDKIGLRKLAEISGGSFKTIAEWSTGDKWTESRKRFQDGVRTKTDDILSDKISKRNAAILAGHSKDYRSERKKLIKKRDEFLLIFVDNAEDASYLASALNALSLAIDRSIKGERTALSLEYENRDAAIAAVRRFGYEPVDKAALKGLLARLEAADPTPIPDQNFVEVAPDDVPPAP